MDKQKVALIIFSVLTVIGLIGGCIYFDNEADIKNIKRCGEAGGEAGGEVIQIGGYDLCVKTGGVIYIGR